MSVVDEQGVGLLATFIVLCIGIFLVAISLPWGVAWRVPSAAAILVTIRSPDSRQMMTAIDDKFRIFRKT